jgi:hypothetical protein
MRAAWQALFVLLVVLPAAVLWGLVERLRGLEPVAFEDVEPDGRPVIRALERSRKGGEK